jgi:uncharacterized membrane protein (UPF0127 family)
MKVRFTAETPYDRARGLMFSKPLASDEIAVFKFDTDTTSGFWNRNVSYPIKIAFFDSNFNMVGFRDMGADQTDLVSALKPYRYAVEMSDSDSDTMMLLNIKNYLEKQYENKL